MTASKSQQPFVNKWRPKCSNPCALCGWGPAYAIHLPALTGPRKGQPWGHAHQDQQTAQAAGSTQTGESAPTYTPSEP